MMTLLLEPAHDKFLYPFLMGDMSEFLWVWPVEYVRIVHRKTISKTEPFMLRMINTEDIINAFFVESK